MNRIPFDHFDEIRLRLSDMADNERLGRLASSAKADPSRLDSLIRSMDDTQRQIVSLLRRKIARRCWHADQDEARIS